MQNPESQEDLKVNTRSERPYRWVYGKLCGSGASLKQYTTYWGTEKSQSESRNKHLI
jgi:hypothetical protein